MQYPSFKPNYKKVCRYCFVCCAIYILFSQAQYLADFNTLPSKDNTKAVTQQLDGIQLNKITSVIPCTVGRTLYLWWGRRKKAYFLSNSFLK